MPDWIGHLRQRLASLTLTPTREAEVIEELSQHLDQRYDELRDSGVSDADARRRTIEELLDPDALARGMRPLRQAQVSRPIMPSGQSRLALRALRHDKRHWTGVLGTQFGFGSAAVLRHAVRQLLKSP